MSKIEPMMIDQEIGESTKLQNAVALDNKFKEDLNKPTPG